MSDPNLIHDLTESDGRVDDLLKRALAEIQFLSQQVDILYNQLRKETDSELRSAQSSGVA